MRSFIKKGLNGVDKQYNLISMREYAIVFVRKNSVLEGGK